MTLFYKTNQIFKLIAFSDISVMGGTVPGLEREPCFCTLDWTPVCGSDGVTYGNACELECEQRYTLNLVMSKEGEC